MWTSVQAMRTIRISVVIGVVCTDAALVIIKPGPWNCFWLFAVGCWTVLNLYWAFANAKVAPAVSWTPWIISIIEYLLYTLPLSSVPILGFRLVPRSTVVEIVGSALCAIGVALAISARHTLSTNWNNTVAPRNSEVLIQSGPYAIVRHPIYSGFILFAVGAILTLLEVRALPLIMDIVVSARRIKPEEKLLCEKYPAEYPAYERRVKRLLPFIW